VADSVLVEVSRGDHVESRHRAAFAVSDSSGMLIATAGDVHTPIFPRSAAKPLQALPLVATGAAESLGLTTDEIALACGSHSGEPEHVAVVKRMLDKSGSITNDLECGHHWPLGETAARDLAARGLPPTALHNNCSGKHAGFLCLARHLGLATEGYVRPDHPVMKLVTAAVSAITSTPLDASCMGIDGCSIPAFTLPLQALATAFARLGTGDGLADDQARAAKKIGSAMVTHPYMVAGYGRFDTIVMQACGSAVLCKGGAEGVAAAAIPAVNLGFAVKINDGAGRAAEALLAALISRFLPGNTEAVEKVSHLADRPLQNWKGDVVGRIRTVQLDAILDAIGPSRHQSV